jgi:phosphopantetheinyl transferase
MTNGQRLTALYCAERGGFDASRGAVALLGHAVSQLFGIKLPKIQRTATGKPYFPERPDICFSLSHTKTHILAAVSDVPVGADVETIRPVRYGLEERVCAPGELRDFDFFELWVLKESFVKVMGETRVNPRDICFRRNGGRIVTPSGDIGARLLNAIPGCAAAVCALGGDIPDKPAMADLAKILADY